MTNVLFNFCLSSNLDILSAIALPLNKSIFEALSFIDLCKIKTLIRQFTGMEVKL